MFGAMWGRLGFFIQIVGFEGQIRELGSISVLLDHAVGFGVQAGSFGGRL